MRRTRGSAAGSKRALSPGEPRRRVSSPVYRRRHRRGGKGPGEAARPKITIDFSGLEQIRRGRRGDRESLPTEAGGTGGTPAADAAAARRPPAPSPLRAPAPELNPSRRSQAGTPDLPLDALGSTAAPDALPAGTRPLIRGAPADALGSGGRRERGPLDEIGTQCPL